MALADRDYLRASRDDEARGAPGGGGGRRWRPGARGPRGPVGPLGAFSFNTWLIIVNVGVFLLTGFMFNAPPLQRPMFFGAQFDPSVPAASHRDLLREAENGAWERFRRQPEQFRRDVGQNPAIPILAVSKTADGRTKIVPVGRVRVQMVPWSDYWGHFSTERAFWDLQVWRFVTFQFLHANFTHLLFNMLGLWFVGGLVESFLGSKRYAAYYLVCGIFGAVSYLILNFLGNYVFPNAGIPGLLFDDPSTPLVGASAGIFGILMAAAYIAPNEIIWVMGLFPARMRPAVYVFIGIAAINLLMGSANAGGEAAHLGGAIAGYFFIRRTHLLRDFFDVFGRDPDGGGSGGARAGEPVSPVEINRILDRIRAHGMQSLTPAERALLDRESRDRRLREGTRA
ncbi:MAG: rhomboid family intramembrane serine protease [Phycisphaerales bacterium]